MPQRGAGHDSSAAVQFSFDSGAPVLFLQDYAVSKVTLCGGNRMIDGHNHFLIGNQFDNETTTNAVRGRQPPYARMYMYVWSAGLLFCHCSLATCA